ncbi:ABC transporter substrate-binding protein [Hoyosella altamirensis]|uniref:Sorbitol/mannitol transport system substrate-binding protein n=1 Tax=Hoyosella altamirensis TaxID=616997 RepID=A0A839RQR9_9ACTN|nr:sugar ABC transporter substrate-binding protein [Hoyosella altamirensis]MBB3038303.1 sorbitol/mannitol transport system substrate-binding protein [Hoyosella altamirensis]
MKVRKKQAFKCIAGAGALVFALSGCAGAGSFGTSDQTVTIAMVSNSQMQDARALSAQFRADNPDVDLRFVTLSENEARAKITASTAMGGGEFDVVMISNYETPQWAEYGWLTNLSEFARETEGYDEDDFIPSLKDSLSYEGDMYSVPFYGESSFLMYRQDLFDEAGIELSNPPTWTEVAAAAEQLDRPGLPGICLRGKPGWGEVLAPLNTVINTFGGRWFDEDWNPQLTSPEVQRAVQFYVDLVREHGQPGAATSGFSECATQLAQGRVAMWYDSTAAVSTIEDPSSSNVVGQIGYALAPVEEKENAGWLYTWSLGIPATSENKEAAWRFISWMTSQDYMRLVGETLGWDRVPPGSRNSTYEIPEYAEVSAAYGPLTLEAMANATPLQPTVDPVPYTGVQFLAIPEFQDLGTRVSQQISAAIAGQKSVSEALEQAQLYAEAVGASYRENQ